MKSVSRLALAVVMLLLPLAACNSPQAIPSPTGAPSATASLLSTRTAPPPTPTPSAPPATPSPVPTPTPIVAGLLPLLPADADLPAQPPLPMLRTVIDDPATLRAALRALVLSATDVWVAAWPQDFLAEDVPLPEQGRMVTMTLSEQPHADVWGLYLVAPLQADAWARALDAVFQKAGWQQATTLPPHPGGAFESAWCKGVWSVIYFVQPLAKKQAVASLTYEHNLVSNLPPFLCQPPPRNGAPAFAPHLEPPPGVQAASWETSGGSNDTWNTATAFVSPDGLQPLVDGLFQQLRAQGWQITENTVGTLGAGDGALLQGVRTVDGQPVHLHLLVWGQAPHYRVWLSATVVWHMRPTLAPSLRLHGQLDDARLLRHALMLLTSAPAESQRTEIWLGSPPTPWPLQALPQPRKASWVAAEKQTYADNESVTWQLSFVRPGTPAEAARTLGGQLQGVGWQKVAPAPPPEPGFQPSPQPSGVQVATFCTQGGFLTQTVAEGDAANMVRVSWQLTLSPRGCAVNRPPAVSSFNQAPIVWLRLLPAAIADVGGTNLGGDPVGYTTHLAWFVDRPLAEQMADFRQQMVAQGWKTASEGTLGEDTAWALMSQRDAQGRTWDALVVVLHTTEHAFAGLLRVAPHRSP